MHGQQILPLSQLLLPLADVGDTGFCPSDEDDDVDLAWLAAAGNADEWLTSSDAAEALDVSVRRLRHLATAGKVDRKRENGRTLYRINPQSAPEPPTLEDGESTARTEASSLNPDTNPGSVTAEDNETSPSETLVRMPKPARDDKTVVLDESDVVYLGEEPHIAHTEGLREVNRELSRLMDNLLDRWSEVSRDRTITTRAIQRALEQAIDLQQCLLQWQDHAAGLEHRLLNTQHVAARALDVAEEVLAAGWSARRRKAALSERVGRLRDQVGLD